VSEPGEKKRRGRGDGGLHFNTKRNRWIATVDIGYDARGKRVTRTRSAETITDAKDKLKGMMRDLDDGLPVASDKYTVADAVGYWLEFGLTKKAPRTISNYKCMANEHIIPSLGKRRLRHLSAEDVDRWLALKAKTLSTRSLQLIHSILNRSIRYAQARDKVKRNVAALCDIPTGQPGRPSKALTLDQAQAVLTAAIDAPLYTYIVLSLLTGARTEELRALRWEHVVTYDEESGQWQSVISAGWNHEQFGLYVWRADRASGDTKTPKSRRSLKISEWCVAALTRHQERQAAARGGKEQTETDLVFATRGGKPLSAGNVRRDFRKVVDKAGIPGLIGEDWTPREMRHTFVSVLSDDGMPIEHIALLVGHRGGSVVTEKVYRQQIRPVITQGAEAMDAIFGPPPSDGEVSPQEPRDSTSAQANPRGT
jgi:integrase